MRKLSGNRPLRHGTGIHKHMRQRTNKRITHNLITFRMDVQKQLHCGGSGGGSVWVCAVRVQNFCRLAMEISRKVCWFFFLFCVCVCVEGSKRGVDDGDWKFCWFPLPGDNGIYWSVQYTGYWWPVCFVEYTRAQTVHIRLNSHRQTGSGALWLRSFQHVKGAVGFFLPRKVCH